MIWRHLRKINFLYFENKLKTYIFAMNTKLDDNVLMDMVFRCLCRVLKNRKIYHRFRCFIGVCDNSIYRHDLATSVYTMLESMQPYVRIAQQGDNPFCNASNKEGIFYILRELLGKNNIITKENNGDMGKVQMRITQLLNTLLHSCVEKTVGNFSEIERIGQETFDMVCKQIYGDDFVDETEKNIPEEVKRLIDAQREYLEGNGMVGPRGLTGDPRFIEFLKEKGVIDENGHRRRPMKMMPLTLDRLERPNSEWHRPTYFDYWEDDDWDYI